MRAAKHVACVIAHANVLIAALMPACSPKTGPDASERLTGVAGDQCNAPTGGGLGHTGSYRDLDVLLTYEDDLVTFEGLATLVCPLVGTHDGTRFDFPSQDCTEATYDELEIHGFGEWQDDVLVLELESEEYHGTIDDPSGPRFPVPCEHQYELTRIDD
jgi:hypothetical protein